MFSPFLFRLALLPAVSMYCISIVRLARQGGAAIHTEINIFLSMRNQKKNIIYKQIISQKNKFATIERKKEKYFLNFYFFNK